MGSRGVAGLTCSRLLMRVDNSESVSTWQVFKHVTGKDHGKDAHLQSRAFSKAKTHMLLRLVSILAWLSWQRGRGLRTCQEYFHYRQLVISKDGIGGESLSLQCTDNICTTGGSFSLGMAQGGCPSHCSKFHAAELAQWSHWLFKRSRLMPSHLPTAIRSVLCALCECPDVIVSSHTAVTRGLIVPLIAGLTRI